MPEDGDVVEIDYTGRTADGRIFDTTRETVAEQEGMDTGQHEFGSARILIGSHHVIPGLEDALRDMEPGDEDEVTVEPDRAFGERDADLIETISEREFDEHDVTPHRGLIIEVDGRQGKVVSASSGRVRVDFNHPMAGKKVRYDVELHRVVDDVEECVDAVLSFHGIDDASVDVQAGDVTVDLPEDAPDGVKEVLQEELGQINGTETVTVS